MLAILVYLFLIKKNKVDSKSKLTEIGKGKD